MTVPKNPLAQVTTAMVKVCARKDCASVSLDGQAQPVMWQARAQCTVKTNALATANVF